MRSQKQAERRELLDKLFVAEQARFFTGELTNRERPVSAHPVELEKFKQSLQADELVLEYVLSDQHSYCVVITRESTELVTLPRTRNEIQSLVSTYLKKVKVKEDTAPEEQELYAALLAPVSPEQKFKWIIVPDGALHLLPFDALKKASANYVLYSHDVTYAPSSTTLYLLRRGDSAETANLPFLGVGDVEYDTLGAPDGKPASLLAANMSKANSKARRGVEELAGAKVERLPGTRADVRSAAEVFGRRSIVLLGASAPELAFKTEPLSQFRVIHLAAHAISDTKFPDRTSLVLRRSPASE